MKPITLTQGYVALIDDADSTVLHPTNGAHWSTDAGIRCMPCARPMVLTAVGKACTCTGRFSVSPSRGWKLTISMVTGSTINERICAHAQPRRTIWTEPNADDGVQARTRVSAGTRGTAGFRLK